MKSIIISIKPEWVYKILTGEKTLEIRKTFPVCEYPIDVYIYCTKTSNWELLKGPGLYAKDEIKYIAQGGMLSPNDFLNGKIDLAAAESVMSLIGASGKQAAAAAVIITLYTNTGRM